MVQTLGGSWWLWLIPLFVISIIVMIPMSLSELGMTKKKKAEEKPAEQAALAEKPEDKPVNTEEDDITEVLVLAAAAYIATEARRGGNNKMRNLKITVNGKTYDVAVEEEGNSYGYTPRYSAAKAPAAAAPAAPKAAPAAAAKAPEASAAAPAAKAPSEGGTNLEAPMSGRIIEIVAKPGTAVKVGDPVLIMEAMKLQSEICSECDGTVKEILVSAKQDVLTGDVLAVIG